MSIGYVSGAEGPLGTGALAALPPDQVAGLHRRGQQSRQDGMPGQSPGTRTKVVPGGAHALPRCGSIAVLFQDFPQSAWRRRVQTRHAWPLRAVVPKSVGPFLAAAATMITSKLTSKAQTTIPWSIRAALKLYDRDALGHELDGQRIILAKVQTDSAGKRGQATLPGAGPESDRRQGVALGREGLPGSSGEFIHPAAVCKTSTLGHGASSFGREKIGRGINRGQLNGGPFSVVPKPGSRFRHSTVR